MTKWRACRSIPLLNYNRMYHHRRLQFITFLRKARPAQPQASLGGAAGNEGGGSQGNFFLVSGATMATILMLGALHVRRLYDDKKIEEARSKGVELDFHPDVKARFLRLLPLRSISRFWGSLTDTELPIWLRPYVYKAWARAFHSNLEEAQLPLEEYTSLREFFVRKLKESSRPIDSDPYCLVSPVDGTVLRFGELRGPRAIIEQVKGCSYSASSLLGANTHLPMIAAEDANEESGDEEKTVRDMNQKSWWSISWASQASPKVRDNPSSRPPKGLFYCVIYLKPGDYHRIHSPVDWNLRVRRHFTGHLFPVNERATRTIRNLYVENERVILVCRQLGFCVYHHHHYWGSTGNLSKTQSMLTSNHIIRWCLKVNGKKAIWPWQQLVRQILVPFELFIEPTLRTNKPQKKMLHSLPPDEKLYEPEGTGVPLRRGDELAAFNMGSTVVLVFQAPTMKDSSSDFRFCIKRGDRIRMGEALGRWNEH